MRVKQGADVPSDHHLLMMTSKLRLKKHSHPTNPRKKYNVGLLRSKDVQDAFKPSFSNKFQPLQELLDEDSESVAMYQTTVD